MTCILGYEDAHTGAVWMASDSACIHGPEVYTACCDKVVTEHLPDGERILVGFGGEGGFIDAVSVLFQWPGRAEGQSFRDWWLRDVRPELLPLLEQYGAAGPVTDGESGQSYIAVTGLLMIGMRGELWTTTSALMVDRHHDEPVVGIGYCAEAIGALRMAGYILRPVEFFPRDVLERALRIAESVQPGKVRGPFTVHRLGPDGDTSFDGR